MPYGRPVSRRRRRRFHDTESSSVTTLARREANEPGVQALAESKDLASPCEASRHHHLQMTTAVPSSALLCTGHQTGVWPLRERLLLASALLGTDNQQLSWPPISRRLAKFTPPASCGFVRPPTWCSARACARQYSLLLDSAEMFRKQQVDVEKSAEEGRVVFQAPSDVAAATATVGLSLTEFIVKRLTVERVEELRNKIISSRQKYRLFKQMLTNVEKGKLDHCIDTLWARIKCQQDENITSGAAKPPMDTPPEVTEFIDELNDWKNPFDVPHSVWIVPGGGSTTLRNVSFVTKVASPKKVVTHAGKPKSPTERRCSDSNSVAEAVEGGDGSDGRTSTPSTSVMSESDLECGTDGLKGESFDSDIEQEKEANSLIPHPSSSISSPQTKLKVMSPQQLRDEGTTIISPPHIQKETAEDWNEPEQFDDNQEPKNEEEAKLDTFQPRSLRLRLSRQVDGNLSVVSETAPSISMTTTTAFTTTPPSSPLRLRLSFSHTKTLKEQWCVNILKEVFPEMKPGLPRKRRRSSISTIGSELYNATKSILTAAEEEVCKTSDESQAQRRSVFVHSVLSQLTAAVYGRTTSSPRKNDGSITANVAKEVYVLLAPALRNLTSSSMKIDSIDSNNRKTGQKK